MAVKASTFQQFESDFVVHFVNGESMRVQIKPAALDDEFYDGMRALSRLAFAEREELLVIEAVEEAKHNGEREKLAEYRARLDAEKYDGQDIIYALPRVITAWEYVDDNDEPLPITEEVVARMSHQLRTLIWERIKESITPKSVIGKPGRTSLARKGR